MKYEPILYNSIKDFAAEGRISFHMPVHNGGELYGDEFCKSLMSLDLTELDATDNLAAPEGAILRAHENMARLFGAQNAHMLVGGSSAGIHAMLLSCLRRGDVLIVDRCVHISVINACVLYGIVPAFMERDINSDFGIPSLLSREALLEAVKEHPEAKAVLITTPTYYGVCSSVRALADIAHEHGMALLADCAHGSHFAFSDRLPPVPTSDGADMCVLSLHKTLGAPTQTALLLHSSQRIGFDRVKTCINMVHTTSPSYILMCAADAVCAKMACEGERLCENAIELTLYAKKQIESATMCSCLPEGGDLSRLVINFAPYETTGYSVGQILAEEYKIDVEMADFYNVVCIVGVLTTRGDIDALVSAVKRITAHIPPRGKDAAKTEALLPIVVQKNPCDAFFADSEAVLISQSAGRICADTVSIYPPGVVCLVPGARISSDAAEQILRALSAGSRVTGLSNGYVRVMKK